MKQLSLALLLTALCTGVSLAAGAPAPASSFTVGVTHVDKYVPAHPTGSDTALILVPGLTDSAAVWNGTIAKFAPEHTIYALTLAGFGGTAPAQAPLVDKAIADIATLISQEHLNKPVLIGHSLGGYTTIRFAQAHPGALRGAVAVDGLPIYPGFEAMTQEKRVAAAQQMTAPMAAATSAQFDAFEKANVVPYLTQAHNVDAVAAAGAGANPVATAQYMTELLTGDARAALPAITVPLLELMPFDATLDAANGQAPFKTAAAKQAYYQTLFPGAKTAKVQVIEGSRHFIMFDQPDAFYAALGAFITGLP